MVLKRSFYIGCHTQRCTKGFEKKTTQDEIAFIQHVGIDLATAKTTTLYTLPLGHAYNKS